MDGKCQPEEHKPESQRARAHLRLISLPTFQRCLQRKKKVSDSSVGRCVEISSFFSHHLSSGTRDSPVTVTLLLWLYVRRCSPAVIVYN